MNATAKVPSGWTTKQLAWGCVGSFAVGAIALYAVGFHWVGQWQTGGEVGQRLAVATCMENFLLQPDRGVAYAELKGNTSSYKRRQLIRDQKWASDREVAALCDDRILALDPAQFPAPETAKVDTNKPA
jgi:hypothetical protein